MKGMGKKIPGREGAHGWPDKEHPFQLGDGGRWFEDSRAQGKTFCNGGSRKYKNAKGAKKGRTKSSSGMGKAIAGRKGKTYR